MRRLSVPWLLVPLFTFLGTAAQDPWRPTFRTGIDILTLDATVLDARGGPVTDLRPEDFIVTIEGQRRRVVSARFYGSAAERAPAGVSETATAGPAAHADGVGAGRLVLFAVDRESIRSGGERAMLEAATSVIDALGPADAAGLIGLPDGAVAPTREHDRVRAALRRMTGTMPPDSWRWFITWEEAGGIERGDDRLLAHVLDRECRPLRPSDFSVPELCDKGVAAQAGEMLLIARGKARATLASLGNIQARLAPLAGPKHVILISGGLLFEQELLSEYTTFARQAAEAGVVVHVIHADQPSNDSTTAHRIITSPHGGRELAQGLTTIAGLTGGAFYHGVGSAAGAFDRIVTEVANLYQLGVEASAADGDGKLRDVRVVVNRPDVTVRTRPQVAVASAAPVAGPTADPMTALLEQPTDLGALPIRVAAYTTRGDDPELVRVVVAAEISTGQPTVPGEWAFTVLNEGNAVATGRRKVAAPSGDPWLITATTKLVPGRYRLRFAALAADGRAGVIDVPLSAGLRVARDLQLSDLVVGTAEAGRLVPRSRISRTSDVRMMIELMASDLARLEKSRAALEIVPAGSAEPVKRVLMSVRSGDADTIRVSEAHIDAGVLTPGRYTASAVALIDNEPVGRVGRTFEIVPDPN